MLGPGECLLTGGIAVTSSDGRHVDGAANSIFVLGPAGASSAATTRRISCPIGEYLPMRPLLSAIGLSRLAPGDLDFAPGPGPRTHRPRRGWGKVGIQLCYEIIFSGEVVDREQPPGLHLQPLERRLVRPLGPAAASRPGAAARGRGRLPVIRSTPTGISAVIDARGAVVAVAAVAHAPA